MTREITGSHVHKGCPSATLALRIQLPPSCLPLNIRPPATSKLTCQKANSSPHCQTSFLFAPWLIVSPSALWPKPETHRQSPSPVNTPLLALLPSIPIILPSLGVSEYFESPSSCQPTIHLYPLKSISLPAPRMLALECSSD